MGAHPTRIAEAIVDTSHRLPRPSRALEVARSLLRVAGAGCGMQDTSRIYRRHGRGYPIKDQFSSLTRRLNLDNFFLGFLLFYVSVRLVAIEGGQRSGATNDSSKVLNLLCWPLVVSHIVR